MPAVKQQQYDDVPKHTTLILCESKQRCQDFAAIAKACDYVVLDSIWKLGHDTDVGEQPTVDYLLIELLSNSDKLEQSLSEIARYLELHHSQVLLWIDLGLLEAAFAALPGDRCHFLVNASEVEAMPILSGTHNPMVADQLHDKSQDASYGSLHRMSGELTAFARTLATLAESDTPSQLTEKPVSFRPAPANAFQQFVTGGDAEPQINAAIVRQMIKLRRMRDNYFEASLFADPAWDILLDLMAAKLENRQVSVSSLCIAASVPATTALRWVSTMTENGLLIREHDPEDARRVFIGLSADTETKLRQYLFDIQKRPASAV